MNIETDFVGTTLALSKPLKKPLNDKFTRDEFMNITPENGWRQPKRWELIQLFDEAKEVGFLFSDTTTVWSASVYARDCDFAWEVNFDYGYSAAYDGRSGPLGVRLVKEVK